MRALQIHGHVHFRLMSGLGSKISSVHVHSIKSQAADRYKSSTTEKLNVLTWYEKHSCFIVALKKKKQAAVTILATGSS